MPKVPEIDRLHQVTVCVQAVRLPAVLLGVGGRQDHDRDHPQLVIRFQDSQHLVPVHLRQIEVQKDHVRSRLIPEPALLTHVSHCLNTVIHTIDRPMQFGAPKALLRDHGVSVIVLDKQHMNSTPIRHTHILSRKETQFFH